MKYQLLFIAFLFAFIDVKSQFITSTDTVLCSGEDITLVASGANISPTFINTDDIHSGIIDMGFDFTFYGNIYNQCVLSANGYITFDLAQDGLYSPWTINNAIPNAGQLPENAIMAPWHDIDPSVGGSVVFGTYGAAPNRVFYVVWCNMPLFQCNDLIIDQYVLMFEGSNKIEMHLNNKPLCPGWNGGAAVQGIVNENSTLFEIVDDPVLLQPRNFPLNWTADDEGWEFIPNADFTDYTINEINYSPIATGTVVWSDQYGNILSDSLTLSVTPDTGAIYYYISVVDVCTGETINNVDSVLVQTFAPTNAGLVDVASEDSTIFLCDITDGLETVNLFNYLGDDYEDDGNWFENNVIVSYEQDLVESSTGDYFYITYGVNDLCNDTSFISLNVNKLPEAGVEGYKLVCSGDPTFSMFNELNGTPQTGGGWYNPNNDFVIDTFDPLTSEVGTYTYVVEGVNACPSDSQFLYISYQEGFEIESYSSPVSCNGFQDGSIVLFANNNTVAPITYSIDGGATYFSYNEFDNLEFGTYNVVVRDGNGCITDSVAVVSSAAPEINVLTTATDVLCYGDSSATVSVSSISGGNIENSSYQYNWFQSGTDELVGTTESVQVPVGGYYLVVEDDNGCQGTDEVSVEQANPITFSAETEDITCFGGTDGQIQVVVTGGGTPPYNLKWTNQGDINSSFLFDLSAGVYDLEISDANDCMISTSFELEQSTSPLIIEMGSVSISCFGESTGTAQITANGGTPPYSYEWSSGHVTDVADQLPQGVYYVDVTDARGCVVSDSVTINENSQIINNISSVPVSCYDGSDGSATVSSSGGTGSLIYNWSTGSSNTTITNQSFGEYWIKVEDELGCFTIDTIEISQPKPLKLQLVTTDVKCNGGSDGAISSIATGGTAPYNYDWSLSGNSFGFTQDVFSLPSTDEPYILTVTDNNSCQSSVLAFVNEPDPLVVDTSHLVSAYCLNIPTGEVSVIASGGFLNTNSSYSFLWNTGESEAVLTNKTSGSYSVIVEDDNACKDTLNIEIPLEETFTLQLTSDSLNCFSDGSGSATVMNSGGFAPYDYQWNTTNGITQVLSASNTNTLLSLSEGVASVVVTDVNGCTKTAQVDVLQPNELVYTVTKLNNESCSGQFSSCDGVLKYTAFGGTGIYTFSTLDLDGNFISEHYSDSLVIDSALCADFYQISVTDEHGCSGILSGSGLPLPVEIIAGSPVTSSINTTAGSITNNILCYGDTAASLSVSNPNPSFTYDWYVNGELFASGLNVVLPSGDVHVQAVSSSSCYTNSDTITIFQPSQLSISQEVESVNCNGGNDGSISVEVTGGFPSYSFSWSTMGNAVVGSTDLIDLSAGVYTLTLEDANDCQRNFDVEVLEPSALTASSIVEDVSCNGGDDGNATISIAGGVGPYMMNWQGADPTSLSADTYEVIITDANSCTGTIDVEVSQPTAVVATFNASQTPFTASASGGTPPYTFEWLYFGNYQSSGTTFSPTESGDYTLVATDANDCEGRLMRIYNTVGVSEFEDLEVLVYPNPVKESLIVEVTKQSNLDEDYIIKILDYRGRVVKEDSFKRQIKINRNAITPGLYVIVISSQDISYQEKIFFE
ncbi:MAG: T9SS type A sorting domain-containing protein [Flavobacteriales bacterium]